MGYGTLAGADAYFAARGKTAWAAQNTTERTQALQRAADYVKYTYVTRFDPAYTDAVAEVESATYEAAILELATPGFFTKTYTEADRKVLVEVKGIKWQPVGTAKDATSFAPKSSAVDALLWRYMARTVGAFVV